MSKLILNPEYQLYEQDGRPICDSLQVAGEFEKRHDNVLRDIDGLISNLLKFEEIKIQDYFIESEYKDSRSRKQRRILMPRDGFMLLTMGFEGDKALRCKLGFINRYNAMESFIKSLTTAKLEHPAFTEAIMNAHEEPKHYHFSNEADMINRIVLGMSAKKFREMHEIPKGESIRPYLSTEQIKGVEALQRIDIGLIIAVPEFQQRQLILAEHYKQHIKAKQIPLLAWESKTMKKAL